MGDARNHPKNCACNVCTKGWFSRRHSTRDAHDAAVALYRSMRGKAARRRRAQSQDTERS